MEKKESTEIKRYLIDFVSDRLEKCPLFRQSFGRGFARRSLKKNVNKVYTNDFDENVAAYYSTIDKNITFCTMDIDDEILTVDIIKANPSLIANMFHEGVHAVLNKGKFACKANRIIYGTGIQETTEQGKEYGRGLNEGLTNWICEKAGIRKNTYCEETNFVKQLELALGEKKIMKMAKGKIRKNVSKQLNMTPDECYLFLKMIDDMHNTYARLSNYCFVETILDKLVNILSFAPQERTKIYYDFERMISSNYSYYLMCNTWPYINLINRNDISAEDELEFFREQIKGEKSRLSKKIAEIESKIFEKYFKKDFEKMMVSGYVSKNDYEKFKTLSQIMGTTLEDEKLKQYSSYKFLRDLKQMPQSKAQSFRESQKIILENASLEKVATVYNLEAKRFQHAR